MGVWRYDPAYEDEELTDEQEEAVLAEQKHENFGFVQAKRLPENIGYLELHWFADAAVAGSTAVAAMNFLANSDALIIDLRKNGGGSGNMVNLICSYLLAEPKLSISMYSRFNDKTRQGWTRSFVPGLRMTDIPVYVLISGRTASAAEHLSYFLQAEKRATIVGSTSRGAANPCEYRNYPDLSISIQIPAYKATNPITGEDWEGIGVKPDIAVSAEQALDVACKEAAKLLANESRNASKQR
jgi:C-terminal processing protease CtpA/Prc